LAGVIDFAAGDAEHEDGDSVLCADFASDQRLDSRYELGRDDHERAILGSNRVLDFPCLLFFGLPIVILG